MLCEVLATSIWSMMDNFAIARLRKIFTINYGYLSPHAATARAHRVFYESRSSFSSFLNLTGWDGWFVSWVLRVSHLNASRISFPIHIKRKILHSKVSRFSYTLLPLRYKKVRFVVLFWHRTAREIIPMSHHKSLF